MEWNIAINYSLRHYRDFLIQIFLGNFTPVVSHWLLEGSQIQIGFFGRIRGFPITLRIGGIFQISERSTHIEWVFRLAWSTIQ